MNENPVYRIRKEIGMAYALLSISYALYEDLAEQIPQTLGLIIPSPLLDRLTHIMFIAGHLYL
jgi:hypothetical protein